MRIIYNVGGAQVSIWTNGIRSMSPNLGIELQEIKIFKIFLEMFNTNRVNPVRFLKEEDRELSPGSEKEKEKGVV